jgi:hypothetical protein
MLARHLRRFASIELAYLADPFVYGIGQTRTSTDFSNFANTSPKCSETPMNKGFPIGEVLVELLTNTSPTPH